MDINRPAERLAQLGLPLNDELRLEEVLALAFPGMRALLQSDRAEFHARLGDRRELCRLIKEAIDSGALKARTETIITSKVSAWSFLYNDETPPLRRMITTTARWIHRDAFASWLSEPLKMLLPQEHLLHTWIGAQTPIHQAEPFHFRIERHRDAWSEVMEMLARQFYERNKRNATGIQAWEELRMNSPEGYGIKPNRHSAEMPGERKLERSEFLRRWDRYSEPRVKEPKTPT